MRTVTCAWAALMLLPVVVRPARAAASTTAASFQRCFGGTFATGQPLGRVTLTRSLAGVDAGCDFESTFPLEASRGRVSILPDGPVNGGYYTVTVLFFAPDERFIGERVWVEETSSSDIVVLPDVRRLARSEGMNDAARYLLRFRIQPFRFSGDRPAFTFRDVLVEPVSDEPAATWNLPGPAPHLAAHYMAWFETGRSPENRERTWEFWRWEGAGPRHDPRRRRRDGRRDIASVLYPLIGPYASWSRAVVRYHLETARAAGISVLLVDWYGARSRVDERMPLLLNEAARLGMRVAICYEEKINFFPEHRALSSRQAVIESVVADLDYVLSRYGRHPGYLRRGGVPFVFQFNAWGSSAILGHHGLTPAEFVHVFHRLQGPLVYGRQNLDERYHPTLSAAYTWWVWTYSDLEVFAQRAEWLSARGRLGFFMSMVSPGFDDTGVWGWGEGPRRSTEYGASVLAATTARALIGAPEMVQVVTWNDFPEGTAVEPTVEHGFAWVDALERWWGGATGRPVNLADNRGPFLRYLRRCSREQRAEIPVAAFRHFGRVPRRGH